MLDWLNSVGVIGSLIFFGMDYSTILLVGLLNNFCELGLLWFMMTGFCYGFVFVLVDWLFFGLGYVLVVMIYLFDVSMRLLWFFVEWCFWSMVLWDCYEMMVRGCFGKVELRDCFEIFVEWSFGMVFFLRLLWNDGESVGRGAGLWWWWEDGQGLP